MPRSAGSCSLSVVALPRLPAVLLVNQAIEGAQCRLAFFAGLRAVVLVLPLVVGAGSPVVLTAAAHQFQRAKEGQPSSPAIAQLQQSPNQNGPQSGKPGPRHSAAFRLSWRRDCASDGVASSRVDSRCSHPHLLRSGGIRGGRIQ
jgi:hypothetical protein